MEDAKDLIVEEEVKEAEPVVEETAVEEADDLEDTERIIGVFGEDEDLINFIIENDINDLHEGNFGIVDGKLVMTDFSGF